MDRISDKDIEHLLTARRKDVTLNDISKFLGKLDEKLYQCGTDEISDIYHEIYKVLLLILYALFALYSRQSDRLPARGSRAKSLEKISRNDTVN